MANPELLFLEEHATCSGPVLYISAEDTRQEFQQKLRWVSGDAILGDPAHWRTKVWINALNRVDRLYSDSKDESGGLVEIPRMPNFLSWLEERLKKGHKEPDGSRKPYAVCIIDTFWAICSLRQHRGNDYSLTKESYAEINSIKKLAERYNVAIVLSMHCNKREGGDIRNKISGDMGQLAPVTGLWILERCNGERRLWIGGRRMGAHERVFIRELTKGGLTGREKEPDEQVPDHATMQKRILRCLADQDRLCPQQIAASIGMNTHAGKNLVRVTLNRMRRHVPPLVTIHSDGSYSCEF